MYERKFVERYENYNNHLYEKQSLSRVWKHSQNGFFMMSSFRGQFSLEDNLKRHEQLKKSLKQKKLGFFEIDGTYKYDDGHTESELSLFVPFRSDIYSFEEFEKIALELGKKFNQESVLVKYPVDEGNEAVLLYSDSAKKDVIGTNVGYDKVSFAYSKLRKGSHKDRTFIIEGFRIPNNHIDAYKLKLEGIQF